jgi:hypothetical protein
LIGLIEISSVKSAYLSGLIGMIELIAYRGEFQRIGIEWQQSDLHPMVEKFEKMYVAVQN